MQTFPRGDSLSLKKKQLGQMGSQYPYQREDRRARVSVNVAQLWLESFRASRTVQLIEDDRDLFEHLADVAESSYASAMGRTRQQDLVRAQLELTRLEDRLEMLHERQEMANARLLEWLSPSLPAVHLPDELPKMALEHPELFGNAHSPAPQVLATYISNHPAILNIDAMIESSDTGIELAKQSYKPQWSVNAGYGYRDNSPTGQDRPDFLSVGIAFDIPLFTDNKQDKQVQAAIANKEATRTEKALLLRGMIAGFDTQYARLQRLDQRRELYQSRLLAEMAEQAQASLNAYTNDDGDFAEVVRARIAELNAKIDALDIEIDRLKTISQLNYFFAKSNV
jgi:outer membrane protein TolC